MRPLLLGWILMQVGTQATWAAPPPSLHARDLVISQPGGSVTDAAGNRYVTEQSGSYVYRIAPDSSMTVIGSPGKGPGRFLLPIDPTIDEARRRLYVVDYGHDVIDVYDLERRTWIAEFGGRRRFDLIGGIGLGSDGTMYVAERGRARVHIVSPETYRTRKVFGHTPAVFISYGKHVLACPTDVAVVDTVVYVMDGGRKCIMMYTRDGQFLSRLDGGRGGIDAQRLSITDAGYLVAEHLRKGRIRTFHHLPPATPPDEE